jgi:hypothetical protein
MKQSEWKDHIEFIEAEMLKRGSEQGAPEILKQFGTRLSSTIHHFFAESNTFIPNAPITVEQQAFMHSLQLYDMKSVIRLVANYDDTKGLKVVLPGIEKSYRSLMVIQKLEQFTNNSRESTALDAYKSCLEEALSKVLKCQREDLYEEDVLAEKMVVVSGAPEALRNKFFTERLRTLFSSNYRAYLMLKNRYFLKRLKRLSKNPKYYITQQNHLAKLTSKFKNDEDGSIDLLTENIDFRMIEQLVKEQFSKTSDQAEVREESTKLQTPVDTETEGVPISDQSKKTETAPQVFIIEEKQVEKGNNFDSVSLEISEETMSPYEQLCISYAEPLEKLSASFCPVPECSSPYFRSRVEEYRDEFANYFQHLHGGNVQVIAASHNFTLELLMQLGQEYHATERWGVVPKYKHEEADSIYFRLMEDTACVLDRKAEWSMLIHARLPFRFFLPLEKAKTIEIEKDKLCVFQIGTAFFDQNHQKKLDEYPDVFFKLMFNGHFLTGKNAVIYVEEDPFFTTTLLQMWNCRGLVYLFLMAISHRFAVKLPTALQDFLVEVLPNTLLVNGTIAATALPPDLELIKEV